MNEKQEIIEIMYWDRRLHFFIYKFKMIHFSLFFYDNSDGLIRDVWVTRLNIIFQERINLFDFFEK